MMPHSMLLNRWRVRDHYFPTQKVDQSLLFGCPAVNVLLAPVINILEDTGFEKFSFTFL